MPNTASGDDLGFHIAQLTDPRCKRTQAHDFQAIMMIAICALLCGAETFVDFERFGKAKREWLSTFLNLKNGIPSHDTFGRVFALLDPRCFSECFANWTRGLRKSFAAEIVAIDGKTLRRSHDRARGIGPIHMVSAFARDNGMVLGQRKVDSKSNEITAIPELLRSLALAGCIVTIDAMGCQKAIVNDITAAGAGYVLGLKGNQGSLLADVSAYFEALLAGEFPEVVCDTHKSVEKGHGRHETRRYTVTADIEWLTAFPEWKNLQSVGMVESVRVCKGETSTERRFYISSLGAEAVEFARAVRGHWSIENSLHWSLDVSFGEDQCRVRIGNAAENFAILRHLALNILKGDTTQKVGIKAKQKSAGWDHSYLTHLLSI